MSYYKVNKQSIWQPRNFRPTAYLKHENNNKGLQSKRCFGVGVEFWGPSSGDPWGPLDDLRVLARQSRWVECASIQWMRLTTRTMRSANTPQNAIRLQFRNRKIPVGYCSGRSTWEQRFWTRGTTWCRCEPDNRFPRTTSKGWLWSSYYALTKTTQVIIIFKHLSGLAVYRKIY